MTATLESFDLDELPPEITQDAESDSAPDRCAEPGCTNGTRQPGARGRAPKYCPEHKKTATQTRSKRATGKGWAAAPDVDQNLTVGAEKLGKFIERFAQEAKLKKLELDGKVISVSGPKVAHELVELAKNKDREQLRKVLMWMSAPGDYGPLVLAVGGLALPIMINHDLIPLQFFLQLLGFAPKTPVTSGNGNVSAS